MVFGLAIASLVALGVVWKTFIVVPEREQVIKERLGKYQETLKPGFHFMIPLIEYQYTGVANIQVSYSIRPRRSAGKSSSWLRCW